MRPTLLKALLGALLLIGVAAGLLWRSGRLSIHPPQEPEAQEWLERFYREQEQAATALRPARPAPAAAAARLECGATERPRRSNLVVGVVGDSWEPSRWLAHPEAATFDLAVVYYGANPNFTCPLCSHVIPLRGPKWYLYYRLTQSPAWQDILARGYDYIMLPDDDLRMDTCQLNTFFGVLKEFSVVLAQPSVCLEAGSYTCWAELFQDPSYRLRFTNFVEIMAPAVRMDFFQAVVRHTLQDTYTGYGLDFIWPALLHWPRDKVAVVDEICMVHPPSPPGGKKGGLYQVTNMFTQESGKQEQRRTNRKYNYWQPVVWSHGMLWKTPKVFGGMPRPGPRPPGAGGAVERGRAAALGQSEGSLATPGAEEPLAAAAAREPGGATGHTPPPPEQLLKLRQQLLQQQGSPPGLLTGLAWACLLLAGLAALAAAAGRAAGRQQLGAPGRWLRHWGEVAARRLPQRVGLALRGWAHSRTVST